MYRFHRHWASLFMFLPGKLSRRLAHLLELREVLGRFVSKDFVPVGLDERKVDTLNDFTASVKKVAVMSSFKLDRIWTITRRFKVCVNPRTGVGTFPLHIAVMVHILKLFYFSMQPPVYSFFSWPLKTELAPRNDDHSFNEETDECALYVCALQLGISLTTSFNTFSSNLVCRSIRFCSF